MAHTLASHHSAFYFARSLRNLAKRTISRDGRYSYSHTASGKPTDTDGDRKSLLKYDDAAYNQLWKDMAPGYINWGMIRPDDPPEMTMLQGNEAMVDYIIQTLGITEESNVLDLGCGMGMYIVQISKRTGCRYVGTDKSEDYVEICKKTAEEFGVAERGEFLVSSWEQPNESVRIEIFNL